MTLESHFRQALDKSGQNYLTKKITTIFLYSICVLKYVKNKREYFACIFKDKSGTIIMKDGFKIEVEGKRGVRFFNAIFFRQMYGLPSSQKVIFDIGANTGLFSLLCAYVLGQKDFKIYAFEPFPETFQKLVRNIEINGLENKIIPINKGLSGNVSGMVPLYTARDSFDHSVFNEYETDKKVMIEQQSLLEFMNEYKIDTVELAKVNCEGAEYDILQNTPSATLTKIKEFRMEYHNFYYEGKNYQIADLVDSLKTSNYFVTFQLPYLPEHGIIWLSKERLT